MKIISNENETNILLNNEELEIFKEILGDASLHLDEYGYSYDIEKDRDIAVDKMINDLWEGLQNERID